MRILFAGTPDFAATALRAITSQHEVVAVLTQPDRRAGRGKQLLPSAVKVEATKHQLPVLQPERLKPLIPQLEALQVDAMVVVAYGMLIPQSILDIPRFGCLNIHASILPRWRGAAPIQRAIEAGDLSTGVSIMQMEAGLDTGPVFTTLTTTIEPEDTSASLHERLAELGAQGILQVLEALATNTAPAPIKQDDSLANYAHKLDKAEANIDWNDSAETIERRIRAFIPWPICQTVYQDVRLRIWRAQHSDKNFSTNSPSAKAGQILAINDDAIIVQCGKGQLQINQLQKDGGKILPVAAFCNGFDLTVGATFEPLVPTSANKPT